IAPCLKYVNREIRGGGSFFGDIRREGVLLHTTRRFSLASPKEGSPAERAERAERNFSYWFESADEFLKMYAFGAGAGLNSNAAFQLHQATERLYTTAGMVFTGYKRKEHSLIKLHEEVAPLHPDLRNVLPRDTPQ